MPEDTFEDYDIGEDDQDRVIMHMIEDSEFMRQCERRKIVPDYFTGDGRYTAVEWIRRFFVKYQRAPQADLVEFMRTGYDQRKITKKKLDEVMDYLNAITEAGLPPSDNGYLVDRLDFFVKKRVATMACDEMESISTEAKRDPDAILDIMRNAIAEVTRSTGRKVAESMREDPQYDFGRDILTRFGVPAIDRSLGGGLQVGQLVVIQGYTNRGKSWIINHLAKHAARHGRSSLVIPTEMGNWTWRLRMKMSLTGLRQDEVPEEPKRVRKKIDESMTRGSDIMLLEEEEKGMAVTDLPSVVEEVRERSGRNVRLVLLDSADEMEPPPGQYRNNIERSKASYIFLKNYAKDEDMCIVTTSQSQRRGETRWWLTSGTIGDDINKVRKAHVGISINALDDELEKGLGRLLIFKNTDGPVGAKAWIQNDYSRGQFAISSERYNKETYREIMRQRGISIEI